MITYKPNTIDTVGNLYLDISSFQMYATNDPKVNKLFITNMTKTLYSLDIQVSDYSVNDISTIKLEELIAEKTAFINVDSQLKKL